MSVQVQAFDLTVDPAGTGTPLVDVTVAGLTNGTTTGLAPYTIPLQLAGHTIGYRHRAVSLADGSLLEPAPWSELGIPSETAVVEDLVDAETHLRKTVSGDGSNWFNVQRETSPSYSPDPAPADPRAGSYDDAPADAGDAIPVFAAGTPISFRYEVWLDAASTGVVKFDNGPTGVVTDDNGTVGETADDFQPVYVSGDDGDALLEPGETWLYEASQIRTAVAGEVYANYSAIPAGDVHRPDNPGGPSEGTTTPREDPAGYVVPLCSTTAVNPADGTNYVSPDGGTIDDTVSCTNLPVGEESTVSGELQAKQPDGSVIATGITASSTFTPSTWPSSSTVVTFSVPSSMAPGLYVVFETITSTETGETVAVHHDPEDEAQSFVVRSLITVTTQTCAPVVTAPKGSKTGLTCDRITVYGDPGDVVTGTSTAYPWSNGVRQCGTPGATAPWTVTIDATGVGFVETAMVTVPVGPDWEWIESASTADGRRFMRDCATSPRDTNESFAMRKGGGGGNIPSTGSDAMSILQLGGVLVGVGAAMSLLVLRRRRPAMGM
ncbi:MAG: VaFE repeat-containing surface-anchored protein [Ilumatobacteraceae bacterium]